MSMCVSLSEAVSFCVSRLSGRVATCTTSTHSEPPWSLPHHLCVCARACVRACVRVCVGWLVGWLVVGWVCRCVWLVGVVWFKTNVFKFVFKAS